MSGKSSRRQGDRGPREERPAEEVAQDGKSLWREGGVRGKMGRAYRNRGLDASETEKGAYSLIRRPEGATQGRIGPADARPTMASHSEEFSCSPKQLTGPTTADHGKCLDPTTPASRCPRPSCCPEQTLSRLEAEYKKAQALLQKELARTQRWTVLAAGALATQVDASSEEAARLRERQESDLPAGCHKDLHRKIAGHLQQ